MKRSTEYQVNPLNADGDIIDPIFFGSLKEAKQKAESYAKQYHDCVEYEIEKCVSLYADDGELCERDYEVVVPAKELK